MNKYLEDTIKRHPWLEIKGDESEEQLATKSRWQFIMSMSPAERRIFWAKQDLKEAEERMAWLIEELDSWKDVIQHCVDKGWKEHEKNMRAYRKSIMEDVKKQREVVRCQRMKLNKLLQKIKPAPRST